MKPILRILILLLLALNASAQYPTLLYDAITTVHGTVSCTSVSTGGVSTGGGCFGPGAFWIGAGSSGGYVHTFSKPVYRIMIPDWALNGGSLTTAERKEFSINGLPYPLSPSEMFSSATTCPISGGLCYVSGGFVYGPLGSGSYYNGDTVMITSITPINSIGMYCGNCGSGTVYNMYIDTLPVAGAISNVPCEGDTLKFDVTGTAPGETFVWSGPGGFTSILKQPYIYPASLTDTGFYYVIRTLSGAHDTDTTHVTIKPAPHVKAGSNSPICSGTNLLLTASPALTDETFKWSGPLTFTSTLQNPTVISAPVSFSGIYKVITALNGCMDSSTVTVIVDSTPVIPGIGGSTPLCSQSDTLFLTSSDLTAGVTYSWAGPGGFTSTLQNIVYVSAPTQAAGTYTVTAILGKCISTNTIVIAVDSTPIAPVVTSNAPICSGNTLNMTATSLAGSAYSWTGPNIYASALQNPSIPSVATYQTGTYSVITTFAYPGHSCTSGMAVLYVRVDSTPLIPVVSNNSPGAPGPSLCQGDTLRLYSDDLTTGAGVMTYAWTGPTAYSSTLQNPVIEGVLPAAIGVYTLTATLNGKCSSLSTTTVNLIPLPPLAVTSNSPVCSGNNILHLQATSVPGVTFKWTGPYTFSSTDQNPARTPVTTEYEGIYEVTATLNHCSVTLYDTVVINKTPPLPWMKDLVFCQYYPSDPLQAMGSNILWYTDHTGTMKGNPIPPIPNTGLVAETFYYATQTVKGCTSGLDSMKITVYPTPVVKATPASITVCPHETALLKAIDTDPLAYYHWFPATYLGDTSAAEVTVHPEKNIHYSVVASNMFGCSDTAFVAVTVVPGAVIDLGTNVIIYPGEQYQISPATNCSSFSWFPAAGLSDAHISDPIAKPEANTRYIVHAMTSQGCKIVDSIDIEVSTETLLALPNAFAPGTGANNSFKVIKRGIAILHNFSIFDRWGTKVFETADVNAGWDGTYKGKPQPFGVYIYEINATTSSGRDFIKKGNVTLIR